MSGLEVDLKKQVEDILTEYGLTVADEVSEAVELVSKNAVKKLRAKKVFAPNAKVKTGLYAKGWTVKFEKERLATNAIIYNNGKHGGLAHLLEYGHPTRNGNGRVYPPTPAYPHIAPVQEEADKELLEEVVKRLEKL